MAGNEEFCALIDLGRERRDLDYKDAAAWNKDDKKSCCAIVKDILAMANTSGGSIIVGVEETATGFDAVGLKPDQLKSWESTRVNNFVQNYADPPVNVEIAKPTCGGKQFAVLLVPPFRQVPHLCVKDFPDVLTKPTLYVRTANNASEPIPTAQDYQDLIEQAVRTRQDQMLASMRAILTGAAVTGKATDLERFEEQAVKVRATFEEPFPGKGYEGYFEAELFPARFEPRRFSLDALHRAAEAAEVEYRGWPFLPYDVGGRDLAVMNDGLLFEVARRPVLLGQDVYIRWDLKQSGLLVQRSLIWEELPHIKEQYGRVIDPKTIIFYVTKAIDALVRLYTDLGVEEDEDVTLAIRLTGTRDRALSTLGSGLYLRGGYIAREAEIRIDGTHPLAEWRVGLRDLAFAMAWEVLRRFQVVGGFEVRGWIDKLLDRRL